jgi:hypothetical protein
MRLSCEEEVFLRHWMYDEYHYLSGLGPAKTLQFHHGAVPADLAVLIAAIPDPAEQEAAGIGPPPTEPPVWRWTEETLRTRIAEARAALAHAPPAISA